MTLGELIEYLQTLPEGTMFMVSLHSYRVYHKHLAFSIRDLPQSAGEMLEVARSADGKTYKMLEDGHFTVSRYTDVRTYVEGSTGQELTQDVLNSWRLPRGPSVVEEGFAYITGRALPVMAAGWGSGHDPLEMRVARLERVIAATFPKPDGMELEEFLNRLDPEAS